MREVSVATWWSRAALALAAVITVVWFILSNSNAMFPGLLASQYGLVAFLTLLSFFVVSWLADLKESMRLRDNSAVEAKSR